MKAEEARKQAKSVNIDSSDSIYKKIIEKVKYACVRGQYSIMYYGTMVKDVTDKLKEDGYKVQPISAGDYREDASTEISWLKEN